jgi:protein ImuA
VPSVLAADRLALLRRQIAEAELGRAQSDEASAVVPLGVEALDRALGGGLMRGVLHEACAGSPADLGALVGFGLGIAARAGGDILWVQHERTIAEAGALYGPGLDAFGMPSRRLLTVRVRRPVDALWAMEEGLRCRGIAVAVGEFDNEAADLTATRRLALAAREGQALGLFLRHRVNPQPCAAATRWHVTAAPSVAADPYGGLGRPALTLALIRNRHGRCGQWTILWDCNARAFLEPPSLNLAAAAGDRPHRAVDGPHRALDRPRRADGDHALLPTAGDRRLVGQRHAAYRRQ